MEPAGNDVGGKFGQGEHAEAVVQRAVEILLGFVYPMGDTQ